MRIICSICKQLSDRNNFVLDTNGRTYEACSYCRCELKASA